MIAVAVLAYNREHLLRQCVEKVLGRTSDLTTEIVVWNNASSDGTAGYLDSLTDPRIRVIHHASNIGLNAYAEVFRMTSSSHLVTLDEDVIDAPAGWDRRLLDAYENIPGIGYLATSQVDDERSLCASIMHHRDRHLYTEKTVNGLRLLEGPVGGWCGMTSRVVHDRVGGFPRSSKDVFFDFDAAYVRAITAAGYSSAIFADLEVFHASGPEFSAVLPEKHAFYARLLKSEARKAAVKRVLLRVPFAGQLNNRFQWFEPPPPSSAP